MDAMAAQAAQGLLDGSPAAAAGAAAATTAGRALLQAAADGPVMDTSVGGLLDQELTMLWILWCAFLVFFMQCGFALLEAGTVRAKNEKNILLKNVIDACISTLAWWSVGYAFANGACGDSAFIGYHNFFSSNASSTNSGTYWAGWLFGWAFSATASTIVSGAVAERTRFRSYVVYTTCLTAFVYPVVAHWVWSTQGWLSARRQTDCDAVLGTPPIPLFSDTNGLMDYAGSGVVHMVGGSAALIGGWLLGPRIGRFTEDGHVVQLHNASPSNMTLGVFILWLGWYGFNSGSTQCVYGCMSVAALIAVNTTLATGAGGLTCLLIATLNGNPGDIGPLLNGVLVGAVSITAGCALVQSYAAVIIGVIGALVYTLAARVLLKLRIDDPVDAAPVHFFGGCWGVLSVGFFATETSVKAAYGYANDWGVFYGGSGKQLGMQVLGIAAIAGWSLTLSFCMFWTLRKAGWLRADKDAEQQGLDITQGIGSGFRPGCFDWWQDWRMKRGKY